jgi:hypothetical protein
MTYQSAWSITFTRQAIDVTTLADTAVKYTKGALAITGDFSGLMDDAASQSYLAAADGQPRELIIYPDASNPALSYSGNVLPDFAVASSVTSAVTMQTTWAAVSGGVFLVTGGVYGTTYLPVY